MMLLLGYVGAGCCGLIFTEILKISTQTQVFFQGGQSSPFDFEFNSFSAVTDGARGTVTFCIGAQSVGSWFYFGQNLMTKSNGSNRETRIILAFDCVLRNLTSRT
jgi:hypothetical protein